MEATGDAETQEGNEGKVIAAPSDCQEPGRPTGGGKVTVEMAPLARTCVTSWAATDGPKLQR